MKTVRWIAAACLIVLPCLALAQATNPDQSWGDIIIAMFSAGQGHRWVIFGGLACSLLMRVLTTYGARLVPWFGTDRGGAIMVVVIGLLASFAAALASGTVEWRTIVDGLVVAGMALLAYVIPKKVVSPSDVTPAPGS